MSQKYNEVTKVSCAFGRRSIPETVLRVEGQLRNRQTAVKQCVFRNASPPISRVLVLNGHRVAKNRTSTKELAGTSRNACRKVSRWSRRNTGPPRVQEAIELTSADD